MRVQRAVGSSRPGDGGGGMRQMRVNEPAGEWVDEAASDWATPHDPGNYGPVVGARLLRKAARFSEAAEFALEEDHELAASLATLAGVTAADAVTCIRLGRRSSPRHRDAASLFAEADPQGLGAVRVVDALVRLADRRSPLTRGEARRAVTHATRFVEYAERLAFGTED